ncbi:MAG: flagellar type III secretion system pore protein FliP [Planctomycetota bacterium]
MARRLMIALFALLLLAPGALAQGAVDPSDISKLPGFGTERLSTAVEIALLLTILSLLPAVLVTITSFTRIVIVLSFVRRALSVNELPPNPVLIGLALFLTMFIMAPVATQVHESAWVPYKAGQMNASEAMDKTWDELSAFLVNNTRPSELELFQEIANGHQTDVVHAATDLPVDEQSAEDQAGSKLPMRVVIPAFVLSELKTAFQMGFLLFLPFLVIDLVVSSVLLSMGMFMLPPVMISTPIKILVFVLVDGWHLITESVVTSFIAS